MLQRWAAALLLACAVTGATPQAARAEAPAADSFPTVPRLVSPHRSHQSALLCALGGAALVAVSFPIADEADRRYDRYLSETDPARIEDRWNATVRADRFASGALLAGEGLLAAAVYLRFIHRAPTPRVSVLLSPSRCALACRF